MQNTLVNRDFEHAVKRLRKILPRFSFGLLIGTYLISAIIMGIFHAQKADHPGFMIAAFLVPLAIQVGRGTLVFFFQLNPARIHSRYSVGIIAATALLLLSLWETWLVMSPYGFVLDSLSLYSHADRLGNRDFDLEGNPLYHSNGIVSKQGAMVGFIPLLYCPIRL